MDGHITNLEAELLAMRYLFRALLTELYTDEPDRQSTVDRLRTCAFSEIADVPATEVALAVRRAVERILPATAFGPPLD